MFKILSVINDYDTIPQSTTEDGVYYVSKKNTLRTFRFYNKDYAQAFNDMRKFVDSHKDRTDLRIHLLEFTYPQR